MIQQCPCIVCHKSIGDKENSIFCDLCNLWVQIKCNKLNYVDYQYLPAEADLRLLQHPKWSIPRYASDQAVVIFGIVLIATLKYMLLAV